MPKMGDGMEEGTILRWFKHEGDTVLVDEPIAEIETDKANVEIPAEDPGKLTRILVQEGETVPVGAVIAHIGEVGAGVAATAPAPPVPPKGAVLLPVVAPTVAAPSAIATSSGARLKSSPLARRMAAEMGIDLAQVVGTGGGVGRVVAKDVLAFHAPVPVAQPTVQPRTVSVEPEYEEVEISRMRRAIARRTTHSKQTIPHFYLTMPIDMDDALSLLQKMNAAVPEQKVTVNDLVVKACAVALTRLPEVNVSFTEDEKVRRFHPISIGVAVGTDAGLTIPVIRDCGGMTLRQISSAARGLVKKARESALTPQDMSGGTFTVSNLGMFGIEEFGAIINPPESAILAVGAATSEVVVADDGTFVARHRMRVTLSCDHRTVDGLLGARFLKELRALLETPYMLVS